MLDTLLVGFVPLIILTFAALRSSCLRNKLQKGVVPAAPSGTATLLRLSPNYQFRPRPILAVTDFRRPRLSQPQDVTSRHRGAKPLRRYELLGGISLLSPEYLLSFERRPFHAEPPDHYALLSHLIDLSVSQSSALMPLHSADGYQSS